MSGLVADGFIRSLLNMPVAPSPGHMFGRIKNWKHPPPSLTTGRYVPPTRCTLVGSKRNYLLGSELHASLKGGIGPLALKFLKDWLPRGEEWADFSGIVEDRSNKLVRLSDQHLLGACVLRTMHFDPRFECGEISELVRSILTRDIDPSDIDTIDPAIDEIRTKMEIVFHGGRLPDEEDEARFTEIFLFTLGKHRPAEALYAAFHFGLTAISQVLMNECTPHDYGVVAERAIQKGNVEAFRALLPMSSGHLKNTVCRWLASRNQVEHLPFAMRYCSEVGISFALEAAAANNALNAMELILSLSNQSVRDGALDESVSLNWPENAVRVIAQSGCSPAALDRAMQVAARRENIHVLEIIQEACPRAMSAPSSPSQRA